MSRARRGRLRADALALAATLGLGLLALLSMANVSQAAIAHVPGPTFQLQSLSPNSEPTFIAVDKSSGSVYVEVRGSHEGAIEKFTAGGAKSNFSALGTNVLEPSCEGSCGQIAIDNSGGPNQGYIYIGNQGFFGGAVSVYAPDGTSVATIESRSQFQFSVPPCGVAVDGNGDLIVAHPEFQLDFSYIDKLEVTDWASHPSQVPPVVGTMRSDFPEPCRDAVDSSGAVYAIQGHEQFASGNVHRWEPNEFGTYEGGLNVPESLTRNSTIVDSGSDRGISVDGEDNLWVTRASEPEGVRKYDSSGSLIESLGSGEFFQPWGIAANPTTGTVYVGDGSEEPTAKSVHIFTPVVVPDSLTGQFTPTGQTQGTLSAEVRTAGAGTITSCELEYTPASTYSASEFSAASTVPCEPGNPPINETKSVAPEISGLSVEEPYVFRVRTTNANGASNGTIHSFTPHAVVALKTKPATEVAPRSAKLSASFTGNGEATEYWFEYGPQKGEYINKSSVQSAGSPSGATEVSLTQGELELETTYHFRAVAKNGNPKTSFAEDRSLTTPPAVAGVKTAAASDLGQDGITLNGEFVGSGLATEYFFEYGLTKQYGLTSETLSAGSPTGPTSVSGAIEEYEGYKTYHYRIVAKNTFGNTAGQDMTFEAPPAPLPLIQSSTVSEIEPTSARFSAQVNPNRWPTIYLFEWGPTTEYGNSTGLEHSIGGLGNAFEPVSLPVDGLTPGTLYHFRTVAINLTGVTNGPDQTFMAPGPPTIVSTSLGAVGETTATVSTSVLANDRPTSVHLEYGPSTALGSKTTSVSIGGDSVATGTTTEISGLTPGTTYHVRAEAENSVGNVAGEDLTIVTRGSIVAPPKEGPKKCPKGKVKRHGKCVKKPKPHHKSRHPKRNQGTGHG